MTFEIQCSACEGTMAPNHVDHDVGALLGFESVQVHQLPALVCNRCGAVSIEGQILDALSLALGMVLLARPKLEGVEVRFLRKLLGDTQQELADKLGVDRATVNRWENATTPIDGAQAYAIRTHAFFCLRQRLKGASRRRVESVAPSFLHPPATADEVGRPYKLDATAIEATL